MQIAESRTGKTIVIDGVALPDMLDEAMIRAVVHGFYDAIRKDDLIGPIFAAHIPDADWPRHLDKMSDFWSATLLRTDRYDGRPLPPHLSLDGLGEAHFRRWLLLFRQAVRRLCPPEVAQLFVNRALRIAHSFRLAIAFHHGEDTISIAPISEEEIRVD
ncbi:group III truncated hemoglobin [Rhizobium alvei]|uniref:Group III truncated hemoglobin n=1 Tax=Rhizobium alvei TaxID=1132659 RepID=A0ABT8YGL9_9HYPH|nr:group III truncated hemoglobin [Rhizobium alvei]MDO6962825.1 group III truncated hemoglobin [Rhizobium alvei]